MKNPKVNDLYKFVTDGPVWKVNAVDVVAPDTVNLEIAIPGKVHSKMHSNKVGSRYTTTKDRLEEEWTYIGTWSSSLDNE